ncbi:MAG: rRNA maturation RNase YbeY [Planctomycetota bacterium]
MPAPDADPPSANNAGHASDDPLSPASAHPSDASPAPRGPVTRAPRVTLQLETDDVHPPAAGWLEPHLERAIDLALPRPSGAHRLTLALLDDDAMADLHARYTGVPGTTDVLTFDHRNTPDEPLHADLALGRDVAVREAATRGHDARAELLLYAVHGLLHLLGHDDHDPDAYARMHAAEDALLTRIGLGPVFATTASTGGAP